MYSSSEEEEYDCPLCMEELDIADRTFKPCPCGYKICRFCWHHIRENLNGRCPACRREYSEQVVEFEPISADEISRIKREKKEKERQQKDMDLANRRHLANMRVVQKNLVYIIGLHPKLATEEVIRSSEYFGHFGKIAKVVINKKQIAPTAHANGGTSMQPSAAIYVTYVKKEDAAKAIAAVDGSVMAGRILRASYGTTKYCTFYLRNMNCPNPNCLYLHEPGEDADTISKAELATGKHRMRDQISHDNPEDDNIQNSNAISLSNSTDFPSIPLKEEKSALPATASWGKSNSIPGTPTIKKNEINLTSDAFGPPLSAIAAANQQAHQQAQQLSPTILKRKLEKKKRKELLKQKKEEYQQPTKQTDLINFVLGDSFNKLCSPIDLILEEDQPIGVTGLYDENQAASIELKLENMNLKLDENINTNNMSPLEFLIQSIPTPAYTGTFNPFSHQFILKSNADNSNTNTLFDSPIRKTSRFGFAQF